MLKWRHGSIERAAASPLHPFPPARPRPARTPRSCAQLLECAVRVPDHGKLAPWRFIAIAGEARTALGEFVAARGLERDPGAAPAVVEKDRAALQPRAAGAGGDRPPDRPGHKVPEQEQLLSGGALCFQLLLAADALGFGAQWLTGWPAYDPVGRARGSAWRRTSACSVSSTSAPPREAVPERERPDPMSLLTRAGAVSPRRRGLPGRREHVRVPRLAFAAGRVPGPDGWPVNAVHGFTRFVLELLEKHRPAAHGLRLRRRAGEQLPQCLLPGLQGQPRSGAGGTQAPVRAGASRSAARSASRCWPTSATRPTT